MHMGECIEVEETLGPFEFLCSAMATGTTFLARIDPDKLDLYMDRAWIEQHPSACPFLRPSGERVVCTIHATSPVQCKAYRCRVLQVLGADGSVIGTVTGTLALHTEDLQLREEWARAQAVIAWGAPDVEAQITRYFRHRGYRVA
jgi:hypothetical protein